MNAIQTNHTDEIRLTEFSKSAGCGCKIAPKKLQEILQGSTVVPDARLLVGNSDNDDAAVIDLGNGKLLISTTDFFMPIVDDSFAFGKIAAANAISDVYAMGGKPLVAIAILGWPEKIPLSHAQKVLAGSRSTCTSAGIAMAGGHSIESSEPFFGLAVNGLVSVENLKRNNTARNGDLLYLTKPLGIGILSTAQKRKLIDTEDANLMLQELSKLNSIGTAFGEIKEVSAMTDVTGFGFAGHLSEMAHGSGLSATINYPQLPIYENAKKYLKKGVVPDATYRNWNAYGNSIEIEKAVDYMEAFSILPDAQTNGGLLIAVHPDGAAKVETTMKEYGLGEYAKPVGHLGPKQEKVILIKSSL